MNDLSTYRTALDRKAAELRHAEASVRDERLALRAARQQYTDALQAQALIQQAAEAVQQSVHRRIATVVTRCLRAVFGEDAYEFRIHFIRKRGRTEAILKLARGRQELDPADAAGGGIVDITALGLRLACLMLTSPRKRKLLVLDEPLRHLSRDYRPAAAALLTALAKETGIQILLVTHDEDFMVGKVVELE